jgi:AAA domain
MRNNVPPRSKTRIPEKFEQAITGGRGPLMAGRVLLREGMERGVEPPEELEPGVFLRGRVHWIYAPAGVGKSWLALWAIKRCLDRRQPVAYFDAENGHRIVSERMATLGVDPERVDDLLHYFPFPHLSTEAHIAADYQVLLDEGKPALVVFDSLVNFLSSAGLEENSNDDLVKWATAFTRPARERDIAVVVLDHVPHEGDHARGASRKRDEADVMWALRCPIPFDRDTVGRLVLRRDKDREAWLPDKVGFSVGGTGSDFIFRRSAGTIEERDPEDGLTDTERKTLDAIREDFGDRGATAKEWRRAALKRGVSDSSFWRAKRTVTPPKKEGLVTVENDGRFFAVFRNPLSKAKSGESRKDTPNGKGLSLLSNGRHDSGDSGQLSSLSPPLKGDSDDSPVTEGADSGSAEAVRKLLDEPPRWLAKQLADYREDPDRFEKPTCAAIAAKAFGTAQRWREVLPTLKEQA